jgi:predicted DNA-binding transcriptional regulator
MFCSAPGDWQWGQHFKIKERVSISHCELYIYMYQLTFQQHMHEGYIILSSYDIPELVVFIYMVLVDRGLMLTRKLLNQGFLVVKYFKNLIIANIMEYMCHKWTRICSVCRNPSPIVSSLTTYNLILNKNSTMDINMWSRNCLTFEKTLIHHCFCVVCVSVQCFVDYCMSFSSFLFCHGIVSPQIYGFWLSVWYLQISFW